MSTSRIKRRNQKKRPPRRHKFVLANDVTTVLGDFIESFSHVGRRNCSLATLAQERTQETPWKGRGEEEEEKKKRFNKTQFRMVSSASGNRYDCDCDMVLSTRTFISPYSSRVVDSRILSKGTKDERVKEQYAS